MPTKIAWTDESWNPITGCTKVSPGCAHCYIENTPPMRMAGRRFVDGKIPVTLHPDRLEIPLHWKKPRMVFLPSMGDLFHEDVPDEFISHVFAAASMCPQHTFQILTKRAERMHAYLAEMSNDPDAYVWVWAHEASNVFLDGAPAPPPHEQWPLPNVWLGVSVENQAGADERIPLLLETPAAVRFVSCEPLLGPLNLSPWLPELRLPSGDAVQVKTVPNRFGGNTTGYVPALDWCIVGGESGGPPERRLVERCWYDDGGFLGEEHHGLQHLGPERVKGSYHWCPKPEALKWVRDIRDQCQAAGVPFFLKQLGPRASQGTLLDGREHKEMPEVWA